MFIEVTFRIYVLILLFEINFVLNGVVMFGEKPEIPEYLSFSTAPLSKIFEKRCNSYKYFWFLALLYYVAENKTKISFRDMAKRMIAIAWYPSAYCLLRLGDPTRENLTSVIQQIKSLIPSNDNWHDDLSIQEAENLIEKIRSSINKKALDGLIDHLVLEVPYRFLSPWIHQPTRNYAKVREDSRQLKNNCLYSIQGIGREQFIVINPQWIDFFKTNFNILEQFGYWNLLQFLHSQNMNDPSILKKNNKANRKKKRA